MCVTQRCAHVQVQLLHDGKERGRMYAGYALSSIISPNSGMTEIRAAGVIPALVAVLNTSRVRLHCSPWRVTRLAYHNHTCACCTIISASALCGMNACWLDVAFICAAASVLALVEADGMVLPRLVLMADAAQQAADQTQLQSCCVFVPIHHAALQQNANAMHIA
jgi:hypothetical protein